MGECNREIDLIRAKVHREFPKRAVKQAIDTLKSVFLAHFWRVLRARKRFLVCCAGARLRSRALGRLAGPILLDRGVLPSN